MLLVVVCMGRNVVEADDAVPLYPPAQTDVRTRDRGHRVRGHVPVARHRARFFGRNIDVPVMIIGIGTAGQRIDVVGDLRGVLGEPLITVERAQLCKRDGVLLGRPVALPTTDSDGANSGRS